MNISSFLLANQKVNKSSLTYLLLLIKIHCTHCMLKITEEDYKLPNITALLGEKVLSTGSTEPMLIRGVDVDSGNRGIYVVKFMGSPRMNPVSAFYELLGSWIGRQLDLHVAEPAIIHVGDEFVRIMQGRNGYQNARNSIGINYGSVFCPGYMELAGHPLISNEQLEQAKNILAFDMLISNADRGAGKPNVLSNGTDFLIYDHELAFSFIMLIPFLRNKTPWILGDSERELIEKHHFYKYFKNSAVDLREFVERFLALDDYFWARVNQLTPQEWLDEKINQIRDYLGAIIENKDTFADQLSEILLQ